MGDRCNVPQMNTQSHIGFKDFMKVHNKFYSTAISNDIFFLINFQYVLVHFILLTVCSWENIFAKSQDLKFRHYCLTTLDLKNLPRTFDRYCVSHPNFECLMLLYFECGWILCILGHLQAVSKLSFELSHPFKMICSTFTSSC